MSFKIKASAQHAPKFLEWIEKRGGVAVWRSIDLSRPNDETLTPAITNNVPTTKPHWKFANEPAFIINNPAEIGVSIDKEVKRFHVAIRLGNNGFVMKCTDASTRRIHAAVDKAGEGAYYVFDHETQEAVIMVAESTIALSEWKAA